VTPDVTETDPEGVDYGWVMQMTFITSLFVGTPIVAVLSIPVTLPTWTERAQFAIGIGAAIWFVVSILVFLHAKRTTDEE
jgi:hypothetical protein